MIDKLGKGLYNSKINDGQVSRVNQKTPGKQHEKYQNAKRKMNKGIEQEQTVYRKGNFPKMQ